MIDYRNYLVTDDPSRYAGDWLDNVMAAVEGGVTVVQYRDTESGRDELYRRATRLRDALRLRKIPLIINNDADLAAAVGAEGVHVGQSDMSPAAVRPIVGPDCEIGLSITEASQVPALLEMRRKGLVDAIGIGPVFDATKTKADAAPEMGLAGLSEIVAMTKGIPNCAIGGVTLERAASIVAAGAGGLAIVSAYSKAADPSAVARQFMQVFERI